MERVAVVGAAGFVGRRLVAALLGSQEVVAIGRHRTTLPSGPGVVVRPADAGDRQATAAALAGVDVAFYLVHSMGEPGFVERDVALARSFAAAASDAGVRRIVFLGTIGPVAGSEHLDSRRGVGRMLATGTAEVVELRVGMVLGPGSPAQKVLHTVVERLPVLLLTPWADRRVEVFDGDSVAALLAGQARLAPGVHDVAGTSTTYEGLLRSYARARGLRRLFVRFPWAPHRLVVWGVGLLDPANRNHARAVMATTRVDVQVAVDAPATAPAGFDPIAHAASRLLLEPPTPGVVAVGWREVATWPHDLSPAGVPAAAARRHWPIVGSRRRATGTVVERDEDVVVALPRRRWGATAVSIATDGRSTATLWFLPRGLLGEAVLASWRRGEVRWTPTLQ